MSSIQICVLFLIANLIKVISFERNAAALSSDRAVLKFIGHSGRQWPALGYFGDSISLIGKLLFNSSESSISSSKPILFNQLDSFVNKRCTCWLCFLLIMLIMIIIFLRLVLQVIFRWLSHWLLTLFNKRTQQSFMI